MGNTKNSILQHEYSCSCLNFLINSNSYRNDSCHFGGVMDWFCMDDVTNTANLFYLANTVIPRFGVKFKYVSLTVWHCFWRRIRRSYRELDRDCNKHAIGGRMFGNRGNDCCFCFLFDSNEEK